MEQKGNFLLLDPSEFRDWLRKQKITRKITLLQVHHTWMPNYSTFKGNNHFQMLESMRTSHLSRGFSDIAQQFTTFPDGRIGVSLGRNLNVSPAGIKGANSQGICIENVGDFDSGGDKISDAQRKAIVHLYACLCERLNISIDTDHITYHAWWTESGTKLIDYTPGKSAKTCPGTAFWGHGNTVAAAKKGFIPDVKTEYERITKTQKEDEPMTADEKKQFDELKKLVEDIAKKLNVNGDQSYANNYTTAVTAAKNAGAIKTSADKSKYELNIIQMMFNMGLFNKQK